MSEAVIALKGIGAKGTNNFWEPVQYVMIKLVYVEEINACSLFESNQEK